MVDRTLDLNHSWQISFYKLWESASLQGQVTPHRIVVKEFLTSGASTSASPLWPPPQKRAKDSHRANRPGDSRSGRCTHAGMGAWLAFVTDATADAEGSDSEGLQDEEAEHSDSEMIAILEDLLEFDLGAEADPTDPAASSSSVADDDRGPKESGKHHC